MPTTGRFMESDVDVNLLASLDERLQADDRDQERIERKRKKNREAQQRCRDKKKKAKKAKEARAAELARDEATEGGGGSGSGGDGGVVEGGPATAASALTTPASAAAIVVPPPPPRGREPALEPREVLSPYANSENWAREFLDRGSKLFSDTYADEVAFGYRTVEGVVRQKIVGLVNESKTPDEQFEEVVRLFGLPEQKAFYLDPVVPGHTVVYAANKCRIAAELEVITSGGGDSRKAGPSFFAVVRDAAGRGVRVAYWCAGFWRYYRTAVI